MRRYHSITVSCTLLEKRAIQAKAGVTGAKVSVYLREILLNGKADGAKRPLPREVLRLIGELNQVAGNLHQIARKRQNDEDLNAVERAKLIQVAADIHQLAKDIKSYII